MSLSTDDRELLYDRLKGIEISLDAILTQIPDLRDLDTRGVIATFAMQALIARLGIGMPDKIADEAVLHAEALLHRLKVK